MKKIRYILFSAALLTLCRCTHKELYYDQPHTVNLKVVFDWKNTPSAHHETMSLYLFPADGSSALRYEFTNILGNTIKAPEGSYTSICLNSDTEGILFRGTNLHQTFEVYTRDASLLESIGIRSNDAPRAEGSEYERVAAAPDIINSDRTDKYTFNWSATEQTLVLYPQISVSKFTYTIKNAENLKHVLSLSGSISGMTGSLLLGKNEQTNERVTTPFEAVSDSISNVSGSFTAFGHCPLLECKHKLVIYAVLSDNSKWYYTYDVTEKIHSAADQRNIHIVLDGLPLPKPVENGAGFQPDIDEWNDVNLGIEM